MQAKAALAEQCGLNKQVGPGLDFSFSTVQEENLKKGKKKEVIFCLQSLSLNQFRQPLNFTHAHSKFYRWQLTIKGNFGINQPLFFEKKTKTNKNK